MVTCALKKTWHIKNEPVYCIRPPFKGHITIVTTPPTVDRIQIHLQTQNSVDYFIFSIEGKHLKPSLVLGIICKFY